MELWVRTTRFGVVGLAAAVLTLAADSVLGFSVSCLRGCFSYVFRFLRHGRLPRGGHFRLLWRLRDRLRGIWSCEGVQDMPHRTT